MGHRPPEGLPLSRAPCAQLRLLAETAYDRKPLPKPHQYLELMDFIFRVKRLQQVKTGLSLRFYRLCGTESAVRRAASSCQSNAARAAQAAQRRLLLIRPLTLTPRWRNPRGGRVWSILSVGRACYLWTLHFAKNIGLFGQSVDQQQCCAARPRSAA